MCKYSTLLKGRRHVKYSAFSNNLGEPQRAVLLLLDVRGRVQQRGGQGGGSAEGDGGGVDPDGGAQQLERTLK